MTRPRVWALLRVSTSEQSTDAQRLGIEAWAKARGVYVTRWLEEHGVSGTAKSRPVLDEIVAAAEAGRVDRVVVAELSRVGRSMLRVVTTMHKLQEAGVVLVSVKEGVDTGTPMGKAMAHIVGVFAEMERERLIERTREGMEAARRKGRQIGRPSIVWDEEADAELVRMRTSGMSLRAIAANVPEVANSVGTPVRPGITSIRLRLDELLAG